MFWACVPRGLADRHDYGLPAPDRVTLDFTASRVRFMAIQPTGSPTGVAWQLKTGSLLLAGGAIASVVALDPFLSPWVPEEIWDLAGLYGFPFKVSIVTAVVLMVSGGLLAWALRAPDHRDVQIVLLLSAMQAIALKVGGLDPLDITPLLLLAFLFTSVLADPSSHITISGIGFFAAGLAILNLPYLILDNPVHFVIAMIKYTKAVILAILIVNLVTSERLIGTFIQALIIIAFISALIGIGQVVLFALTGQVIVLAPDLEHAFKPTPIGMVLRAHGLNTEPHSLLAFLLTALPFALHRVLTARGFWQFAWSSTVVAALLIANLLTWSYGGLVAAGVIIALFPFCIWPHRSIHMLLAILTVPVLVYYLGFMDVIYDMIRSEASLSTGVFQRKMLALVALEEIARNPWIGRGFETVPDFSGNYRPWTVHNAYLQAWTYLGPIGFVVFMTMMLGYTTRVLMLGFSSNSPQAIRFRVVGIALLGLMASMLGEPYLYAYATWALLGLAQATILVCQRDAHPSRRVPVAQ